MPSYKLKYFHARGMAEVSRLIFALADKEYEDVRFLPEEWAKEKPNATFKTMPVLEIDGVPFSQSGAISRYLAKAHGLYGDSDIEYLKIEQVLGVIGDIFQFMAKLYFEKDEATKAEIIKDAKEKVLPLHLATLERLLKEGGSGFFAGLQISLADLSVFEICQKIEQRCGPIEGFPLLKENRDTVATEPNIAKWLNNRPKTEN